ncbi:De-etiolated protein 1 Det1-domain-containing protein, partial [Dichotomocladium elegans]
MDCFTVNRRKKTTVPCNIYHELKARETGNRKSVPIGCGMLKRFTPDGKYLVCLAKCRQEVLLYRFSGTLGDEALNRLQHRHTSNRGECCMFHDFFTLEYKSTLPVPPHHTLSKDFCLFTGAGRYILLASSGPPAVGRSIRTAHAPEVVSELHLLDYCLFVVEVESGLVVARQDFPRNHFSLTRHAGVSIFKNLIALLSLYYQVIYIFHICPNTGTIRLYETCLQGYDSYKYNPPPPIIYSESQGKTSTKDEQVNEHPEEYMSMETPPVEEQIFSFRWGIMTAREFEMFCPSDRESKRITREGKLPYTSLQHRLFIWLYKKAEESGCLGKDWFYSNFKMYEALRVWRMQFLSEDMLLLKLIPYTAFHDVLQRPPQWNETPAIFVVYDLRSSSIQDVFDNSSIKVEQNLKEYDHSIARGMAPFGEVCFDSTPSNCVYARGVLDTQVRLMSEDAGKDIGNAMRYFSLMLPATPESQPDSPYFELSSFKYSDSPISHNLFENGSTIKFFSRQSGELVFEIDTACEEQENDKSFMIQLIPHPTLP